MLEALSSTEITVEQVLLATTARGEHVAEIIERCGQRQVPLKRVAATKVTRISGNGRHDQGVVADVAAPGLTDLGDWLQDRPPEAPARLVLLDGVTNPANVGMVLRVVTAAGLEGTVLPRIGVPDLGPLVVKASAGIAFRARVLRAPTAADAVAMLLSAGFAVVALAAGAGPSLYDIDLPPRVALVAGNETEGISTKVAALCTGTCSIPLAGGVESLNVATAVAVTAFELARRRGGA